MLLSGQDCARPMGNEDTQNLIVTIIWYTVAQIDQYFIMKRMCTNE